MEQLNTINIFTDGACKGNPGPGGWGAVLENGNKRLCVGGREMSTTNSRMELRAVVEALKEISWSVHEVCLMTDSQYVQKGISEWLPKWKAKDWKTASKKPVKNVDLWKELDELAAKHSVTCIRVRGRNGDAGNELADSLANRAIYQGDLREDLTV